VTGETGRALAAPKLLLSATTWEARQDVRMLVWESEIEVGEDLARTLIAEQFPDLDVMSLVRLGEGQGCLSDVSAETRRRAQREPERC
jgi:hypothetical protein